MQVKEICDSDSVCIYELDYGKTKVVHRSVFQPLSGNFRQLPFQAVVAQLAGTGGVFLTSLLDLWLSSRQQSIHWLLPPTGVTRCQWSDEASQLFRKHVEHRALVAKVESVSDVKGCLWKCRLSAYLVDTSMEDKDLWIHSLMADICDEPSTAWWEVLLSLCTHLILDMTVSSWSSFLRWLMFTFYLLFLCLCSTVDSLLNFLFPLV